jgi:membrane fusion protein, heavy metal efflux system
MQYRFRISVLIAFLVLTGCMRKAEPESVASAKATASAHTDHHTDEHADFVTLNDKQIQAANIELGVVRRDFAGAIDAPGVIVVDQQRSAAVSSSVSGRVIEIRKSLGEQVARGDVLAIIDSREVAQFAADAAIAQRQRELAEATFQREERPFAEKVSSRQEYEAAKTALEEARTRLRLAQQQLRSAGTGLGQTGQLRLLAPISGVVTFKQINLGDVIDGHAKLFEVADLGNLSVELALSPADAGRLAVGAQADVTAEGRTARARISQLSRVLDPATRQVRAIASLADTKANWRVGETVKASITLSGAPGAGGMAIPRTAVQTIEDKPTVFVREKEGFAIRHVVLGGIAGGYVTVQSGLNGSEQIAVSNTFILKAEHGKGAAGEDHD